jgi:hypothetical protein
MLFTINISPFKVILIYTYGSILGFLLFFLRMYQWGKISVFSRAIDFPAWLFLPIYYIKRSIYKKRLLP